MFPPISWIYLGISSSLHKDYVHPLSSQLRVQDLTIDVGAYEYEQTSGTTETSSAAMAIYSNPTNGIVYINDLQNGDKLHIYSLDGILLKTSGLPALDISNLRPDIYILAIEKMGRLLCSKKLVLR